MSTPAITSDPAVMMGKPVVAETRITVELILEGLRIAGHGIVSIAEELAGANDQQVLALAEKHGTILLTADKDFGELVDRQQLAHRGVILLRRPGSRSKLVSKPSRQF